MAIGSIFMAMTEAVFLVSADSKASPVPFFIGLAFAIHNLIAWVAIGNIIFRKEIQDRSRCSKKSEPKITEPIESDEEKWKDGEYEYLEPPI